MPPGRVPTGRIVDWKPPGKDTAQQPNAAGNVSQPASRDAERAQQMPVSGLCLLELGKDLAKTQQLLKDLYISNAASLLARKWNELFWRAVPCQCIKRQSWAALNCKAILLCAHSSAVLHS